MFFILSGLLWYNCQDLFQLKCHFLLQCWASEPRVVRFSCRHLALDKHFPCWWRPWISYCWLAECLQGCSLHQQLAGMLMSLYRYLDIMGKSYCCKTGWITDIAWLIWAISLHCIIWCYHFLICMKFSADYCTATVGSWWSRWGGQSLPHCNEGDGLIPCEWHSQDYDHNHSCCVFFDFAGTGTQ